MTSSISTTTTTGIETPYGGITLNNSPVGHYQDSLRICVPEGATLTIGDEEITTDELKRFIKVMRKMVNENYPEELL